MVSSLSLDYALQYMLMYLSRNSFTSAVAAVTYSHDTPGHGF